MKNKGFMKKMMVLAAVTVMSVNLSAVTPVMAFTIHGLPSSHPGSSACANTTGVYTVSGTSNYLALRTSPCYSKSNEIGKIYNGDTVDVINVSMAQSGYVYVYSPTLNMIGYVNKSYLSKSASPSRNSTSKIVSGTKNYLALRSSACYSRSNEIGKLYNGDVVDVVDNSTACTGYVYVYSPDLDMCGYVDSAYLK